MLVTVMVTVTFPFPWDSNQDTHETNVGKDPLCLALGEIRLDHMSFLVRLGLLQFPNVADQSTKAMPSLPDLSKLISNICHAPFTDICHHRPESSYI